MTLASLFARWFLLADLTSPWRAQYLLAGLLLLPPLMILKRQVATTAAVLTVALNAVVILPLYLPSQRPFDPPLRLIFSNINYDNAEPERLVQWVAAEQPDIVLVVELDQVAQDAFAELDGYPHRLEMIGRAQGLGVYSRLPLQRRELKRIGGEEFWMSAIVDIEWDGGPVRLVATHPPPPISGEWWRRRDRQIAALGDWVKAQEVPVIVAGDFNAVPWAPALQDLERESPLQNTRRGFGTAATWPTFGPGFRIPIDHVFATAQFEAGSFRAGPVVGSDHLPLRVELGRGSDHTTRPSRVPSPAAPSPPPPPPATPPG